MVQKTNFTKVTITRELHNKVRREAYERRISMREVIEEAVRSHYHWELEEEKEVQDASEDSPKQRPSP